MIVTDTHLLTQLDKPDDWEFFEDYNVKHPSTKIYRNLKTGKRLAICQGLPKVRPDGLKICGDAPNETIVGWRQTSGIYHAKPNIFTAANVVGDTKVTFEHNGKELNWKPQIFLDDIEQSCGEATLLGVDPTNENYHDNVLEWDYGFCKRRLRIIEGALLECWIFTENPNGEVLIKHNQSGDLRLQLGEYQINDDEELVPASIFDKAVYPVTIGASLTVYSTASDGGAYDADADYPTCHVAAGDGTIHTGTDNFVTQNSKRNGDFQINRAFLFFDTSALGAGATVTAGTLSIRAKTGGNEADAGQNQADICIVEGVQNDPIIAADYGSHLAKTTKGSATDFTFPVNEGAYDVKNLNATGYGWINLTGTTKFCLRAKGDVDNNVPTGYNREYIWSNEKGAGFYPRLVVTYTPAVGIGAQYVQMSPFGVTIFGGKTN